MTDKYKQVVPFIDDVRLYAVKLLIEPFTRVTERDGLSQDAQDELRSKIFTASIPYFPLLEQYKWQDIVDSNLTNTLESIKSMFKRELGSEITVTEGKPGDHSVNVNITSRAEVSVDVPSDTSTELRLALESSSKRLEYSVYMSLLDLHMNEVTYNQSDERAKLEVMLRKLLEIRSAYTGTSVDIPVYAHYYRMHYVLKNRTDCINRAYSALNRIITAWKLGINAENKVQRSAVGRGRFATAMDIRGGSFANMTVRDESTVGIYDMMQATHGGMTFRATWDDALRF